jgi:hypothetical protein
VISVLHTANWRLLICIKAHWLGGRSLVRCPILGRSLHLEHISVGWNRGIPKGLSMSESGGIDSVLGDHRCQGRIPTTCVPE